MTETVDYQAVVTDLKARRAALDQLIASVEALILGQGDPGAAIKLNGGGAGATVLPAAIHADTFYGLSLIDAAKKYLKMARRAQHTAEIADAIGKGGLKKRPDVNVLSSILVRAAKGREVTKVGKGMWGLAEWYPKAPKEPEEEERRKRPGRTRKASQPKPAVAKKATPKASPAAAKEAPKKAARKKAAGSLDLALDVLRSAGKPLHAEEIMKRAQERGLTVARLPLEGFLGRQAKAGKVQKVGPSTYAIVG